jgi:hypothetical protein
MQKNEFFEPEIIQNGVQTKKKNRKTKKIRKEPLAKSRFYKVQKRNYVRMPFSNLETLTKYRFEPITTLKRLKRELTQRAKKRGIGYVVLLYNRTYASNNFVKIR